MARHGMAWQGVARQGEARHGDCGAGNNACLTIVIPELYSPAKILEITARAGSVMGIGDGRKIGFGRYVTDGHEIDQGLPWV